MMIIAPARAHHNRQRNKCNNNFLSVLISHETFVCLFTRESIFVSKSLVKWTAAATMIVNNPRLYAEKKYYFRLKRRRLTKMIILLFPTCCRQRPSHFDVNLKFIYESREWQSFKFKNIFLLLTSSENRREEKVITPFGGRREFNLIEVILEACHMTRKNTWQSNQFSFIYTNVIAIILRTLYVYNHVISSITHDKSLHLQSFMYRTSSSCCGLKISGLWCWWWCDFM